jgi:hypothetical protein
MENRELFSEKVRQIREFIHRKNGNSLKIYADEAAEIALLERDKRFISLSSIAYSFSKFYEKTYIDASKEMEELTENVQFELAKASEALENDDEKEFTRLVNSSESMVKDLSSSLGRYIINITFKSRLKAAAAMYLRGASLGVVCGLAEVDKDELSNYIGHTTIFDKYATMSVHERMEKVFAFLGR